MKLINIDFGQVTWLVDLSIPPGSVYLPEALEKIRERYKFVRCPEAADIINPDANIVFEHGKYDSSVIRKFSMHNDGLIAESQAGTEQTEKSPSGAAVDCEPLLLLTTLARAFLSLVYIGQW